MPRETGVSGPLLHHMIHHLCMAYSHLERMMNLTPAHIRNHYFSREDMSHLRVPRSEVANNHKCSGTTSSICQNHPDGKHFRYLLHPIHHLYHHLLHHLTKNQLHHVPLPNSLTTMMTFPPLVHGDTPHHLTIRTPMIRLTPLRLEAAFYRPSPSPLPPGSRKQSIAVPSVKHLVDIATLHLIESLTMEPRLLLHHPSSLLARGPQQMMNSFAPTKRMPKNDPAGRRWPNFCAVLKMTAKPVGTCFVPHLRTSLQKYHLSLLRKNHLRLTIKSLWNVARRDASADRVGACRHQRRKKIAELFVMPCLLHLWINIFWLLASIGLSW